MASELQMIQSISNANNAWSAQQAQKQMDFQREMSNSAHQREVLDLQKAGLNPVLSAFNGNGATTPSGAMADTDTSNTTAFANILGKMLDIEQNNSAAGLYRAAGSYYGFTSGKEVSEETGDEVPPGEVAGDAPALFDFSWKGLRNTIGGFVNGLTGNEKGKYDNAAAYAAGKKIGNSYENSYNVSKNVKIKTKNDSDFRTMTDGERKRYSLITTLQKALTGSTRKLN